LGAKNHSSSKSSTDENQKGSQGTEVSGDTSSEAEPGETPDGECEQAPIMKTHNIFETDIDKKSTFVKIFQFFFPILMAIMFIAVAYYYIRGESLELFSLLGIYYVPPSGKESIIPFATSIGLDPITISLAFTINDVLMCLFLIWNLSYIKKVPYVGRALIYSEKRGRAIAKKYRTFRSLEFIGLILFIAFPFKGSGGVMGTIMGMIIGMNPYKILAAMFIGTFTGALLIAYASEKIWEYVPLTLPEIWLIIIIFIEALIIIRMVYGQFYKKSEFYMNKNREECK